MLTLKTTSVDERLALARESMNALVASQPLPYEKLTPSKLPNSPGIYLITTHEGEIVRAGKTGSLPRPAALLLDEQKRKSRPMRFRAGNSP